MKNRKISLVNANTLELHYWLNDGTHSMDAFIQNKCEYEFLGMLKEIVSIFDAEVVIETEPLADGGLIRWFKIISKKGKQDIKIGVITGVLIAVIATPITTSLSKAIEVVIDKISEDEELKNLEKESLKLDIELKRQQIDKNTIIAKRKSNFYEALEKYPKVTKVSILAEDNRSNIVFEEIVIKKEDYNKYILASNILEPIEIDDAIIEIISPVLKKGNYKWRGVYNGEIVSFNMKSNEFKTLVQTGQIEFKNGSSINCLLEVERRINNECVEHICGFNIIRVNEYFENDIPMETPEGKRYRQRSETDLLQTRLDFKTY